MGRGPRPAARTSQPDQIKTKTPMQHRHIPIAALGLVLALTCGSASADKLYKWVDQDGRVHYSDKVPPEAAAHGRELKSERGLTIQRVAPAKTPEQIEAERRAQAEEEARRAAEAKQAEQDRILLMTFSSTAEIIRARDDRLAAIDARIRLTEENLRKLQTQLEQAQRQAVEQERSGSAALEATHKRIADLQRQVNEHQNFIAKRQQERAALEARFDADLARFKELKGQ